MTATRPQAVLAVDVGGTQIAGGLVDPGGTILASRAAATDRLGRGEGILRNLLALVSDLLEDAERSGVGVRGFGVGVPGVVDIQSGTIGAESQNIPEFRGLPLGPLLAEHTGRPVALDNDVNALTLAEWMFGQGRGLKNLALIAVGTGLGGGLVLNGSLVRGAHGYAGEIGHVTVEMDGRPCFCGSRGCVKAYAAGPDIAAQARELLAPGRASILLELAGGDPDTIDAPLVFAAADRGDPAAEQVAAKAAQALGAAVAAVINLCNPELIVLGGGVMEAGSLLLDPTLRWARFYAFESAFARTRIVRSELTKASGILGAAALFLSTHGYRGAPDDPSRGT
jgi:glucokinase